MDINKIDEAVSLIDKAVSLRDELAIRQLDLKNLIKIIEHPDEYETEIRIGKYGFPYRIPAKFVQDEVMCAFLKFKQYLENRIEELTKQIEEL